MRADPYQARARALVLEAGLDPDAKIDRAGQRPMQHCHPWRQAAGRTADGHGERRRTRAGGTVVTTVGLGTAGRSPAGAL